MFKKNQFSLGASIAKIVLLLLIDPSVVLLTFTVDRIHVVDERKWTARAKQSSFELGVGAKDLS